MASIVAATSLSYENFKENWHKMRLVIVTWNWDPSRYEGELKCRYTFSREEAFFKYKIVLLTPEIQDPNTRSKSAN